MAQYGTRLGGGAFNHGPNSDAEQEYDRLRAQARQEHGKMESCFSRSQAAYGSGDGGKAHQLSQEGKQHQERARQYNKQASDYIFRENNATERVAGDTIDLHGQFVEEAEEIVEQRIRYAQSTGQTHLHVIVGKGNHSPGHIQKIKPKVEQICREMGLQYSTEPNAGRIYINLQGGPAHMPHESTWGDAYNQGQAYGNHGAPQQQQQQQQPQGGSYPGQQQQYGQQQYAQQQYGQQQYGRPEQQFQQEQQQPEKQDGLTGCLKACCVMM